MSNLFDEPKSIALTNRQKISEALIQFGLMNEFVTLHPFDATALPSLWIASDGDRDLICRLMSIGDGILDPLFPTFPIIENHLIQKLSSTGLMLHPSKAIDIDASILHIYQDTPTKRWQGGVDAVASQMAKLHNLPADPLIRTVPMGSQEILAHARAITIPDQLQKFATSLSRTIISPLEIPVIVNLSITPNCTLEGATAPLFLNWEMAALGDPTEDIFNFTSLGIRLTEGSKPLAEKIRADFLNHYPSKEIITRFWQLKPYYHLRLASYFYTKSSNESDMFFKAYLAEYDALQEITAR